MNQVEQQFFTHMQAMLPDLSITVNLERENWQGVYVPELESLRLSLVAKFPGASISVGKIESAGCGDVMAQWSFSFGEKARRYAINQGLRLQHFRGYVAEETASAIVHETNAFPYGESFWQEVMQ